jgi:hypothetical protein
MHILTKMCVDHQQKAAYMRSIGKLKNLSLLKTTVNTWATSAKGTEQLIAIHLLGEHGNRHFFLLLDFIY